MGWAIITTIAYSLGYPAFLCWLFYKKANHDVIIKDQLLRAQNVGNTRASNPFYGFRLAYGALYYRFRPE